MIIIGLTGSIGMGKSTAASMLQQMGVQVHDSDAAVHHAYKYNRTFLKKLSDYFPECCDKKYNVDRKKLGQVIFADPEKKVLLESLLHPIVWESQRNFLRQCRRLHQNIAVLDIPLLFETGAEARCDAVIVVSAPAHIQRARVMARPNMSEEKFKMILNSQMSDAEKRARADYIVPSGLGRKKMLYELKEALRSISAAT